MNLLLQPQAINSLKLAKMRWDLQLGDKVRGIVVDQLASMFEGDTVMGILAGGAARDLYAATQYGIDLQGSGDIDICLLNVNLLEENIESIDNLLVEIANNLRAHGYSVDKTQHHWDSCEYNERLDLVIQMEINGVDFDFLFYRLQYDTAEKMFESFNCNINKFSVHSLVHDELVIENHGFCPKNPQFEYRGTVSNEKEELRKLMAQERWAMIRAAHLKTSSGNPYANIKG